MKRKVEVPIIPTTNKFKDINEAMNSPILFYPEPEPGEVFVPFSEDYCPDIMQGRYMVSNKGYVYDTYLQKKVPERSNNPDKTQGYLKSHFVTYSNDLSLKSPDFYIHRVVMSSFDYIRGCEGLEVNHKDGNKHNNNLNNLEWNTNVENINHARKNKFVENGINKYRNMEITQNDAYKICQLRSNNYSVMNIHNETGIDIAMIQKVIHGELYPEISSQFTFEKIRNDKALPRDKVISIKEYLRDNPNIMLKDIAERFDIPVWTMTAIKTGTAYKDIKIGE